MFGTLIASHDPKSPKSHSLIERSILTLRYCFFWIFFLIFNAVFFLIYHDSTLELMDKDVFEKIGTLFSIFAAWVGGNFGMMRIWFEGWGSRVEDPENCAGDGDEGEECIEVLNVGGPG